MVNSCKINAARTSKIALNHWVEERTIHSPSGLPAQMSIIIEHPNGQTAVHVLYSYDAHGQLSEKQFFVYDEQGRSLEISAYDAKGIMHHRTETIHSIDETGRRAESSVYDGEGNLTERDFAEFDCHDNIIRQTAYTPDNIIIVDQKTSYDYASGEVHYTKYNAEGSIVEERHWLVSDENS